VQPYEYYCLTCGGTDVETDAFANWNRVEQKWEYDFRDYEHCGDCEDDCNTDQRPITDVKILAQIAIKNADLQSAQPQPLKE
jgi:hypothetical protein